jgi:hypothetical protein
MNEKKKKAGGFKLDPVTGLFKFMDSDDSSSDSEKFDEVFKLPSRRGTGMTSSDPSEKKKKPKFKGKLADQDPRRLNVKFNAPQPKKRPGRVESVVFVKRDEHAFTMEDESGLYIFSTKERDEGDVTSEMSPDISPMRRRSS